LHKLEEKLSLLFLQFEDVERPLVTDEVVKMRRNNTDLFLFFSLRALALNESQ